MPTPTTRRHPTGTNYIEIPYPPPSSRVEIIPPKPQEGAVWIDGEWSWQGKSWVWEPGGWVAPPGGGYFAAWEMLRLDNGKLLFAPGSWHAPDGRVLPKPPVLLLAQSSLGEAPTRPAATASPAASSSAAP